MALCSTLTLSAIQFTYHVTFDGWVESYDRSLAERALFERRERLEMKQEEERKRQRAAEEFEVRDPFFFRCGTGPLIRNSYSVW